MVHEGLAGFQEGDLRFGDVGGIAPGREEVPLIHGLDISVEHPRVPDAPFEAVPPATQLSTLQPDPHVEAVFDRFAHGPAPVPHDKSIELHAAPPERTPGRAKAVIPRPREIERRPCGRAGLFSLPEDPQPTEVVAEEIAIVSDIDAAEFLVDADDRPPRLLPLREHDLPFDISPRIGPPHDEPALFLPQSQPGQGRLWFVRNSRLRYIKDLLPARHRRRTVGRSRRLRGRCRRLARGSGQVAERGARRHTGQHDRRRYHADRDDQMHRRPANPSAMGQFARPAAIAEFARAIGRHWPRVPGPAFVQWRPGAPEPGPRPACPDKPPPPIRRSNSPARRGAKRKATRRPGDKRAGTRPESETR